MINKGVQIRIAKNNNKLVPYNNIAEFKMDMIDHGGILLINGQLHSIMSCDNDKILLLPNNKDDFDGQYTLKELFNIDAKVIWMDGYHFGKIKK